MLFKRQPEFDVKWPNLAILLQDPRSTQDPFRRCQLSCWTGVLCSTTYAISHPSPTNSKRKRISTSTTKNNNSTPPKTDRLISTKINIHTR